MTYTKFMVHLSPMTEVDFSDYLAWAIKDFAKDKVDAGNWQAEEALEKSKLSFEGFLPEGINTENHYLFSIFKGVEKVGMIWFFADYGSVKARAFIYDFLIEENFRRQGLGKQALLALEEEVKALDIFEMALHVFGHNTAAKNLYEQLGYGVTNISMAKKLS